MKLIEQAVLTFRRGRSEKVYEVDLCEVGSGQFVVNFRYGRRGGDLKDGTKTLAPVTEAKAREIYEKLVTVKRQQGYEDGEAHAVAPPPRAPSSTASAMDSTVSPAASQPAAPGPATPRPAVEEEDPRRRAVLERLARGERSAEERRSFPERLRHLAFRRRETASQDWPLSRAIWRAGELGIESAAPILVDLMGRDELRDYCIAWALGRCRNPVGIAALRSLLGRPGTPDKVRRIATASLLELLEGDDLAAFRAELAASLPDALGQSWREGPDEAIAVALSEHLANSAGEAWSAKDPETWSALETLYLINTSPIRPAVLAAVASMPLAPSAFQCLRHLFKIAEMRRDAQVFGAIAHRFETTPALYKNQRWGGATLLDRSGRRARYMNEQQLRSMLSSARPTAAYGSKTRWYLRQRVWRTLRRLGELGDPDFVPMAVGVLLPVCDADGRDPYSDTRYLWSGARTVTFDRFARFWAFNHLLYLNSTRYEKGGRLWNTRGGYVPGQGPPRLREEAFPHLWNERPQALLHLLSDSRCAPVHEMAVGALRALPRFTANLPVDAVAMILGAPYEATVRFGFELAQSRFRPGISEADMRELARAVVTCEVADLRAEGMQWVRESLPMFLADGQFLAALVTSEHKDTRRFVLALLRDHPLAEEVSKALVGSLLAQLMTFVDAQEAIAADLVETLQQAFAPLLQGLGSAVVDDLAAHPLAPVQSFAAWLLLEGRAAERPSEATLEALLESPHAAVRAQGVQVLGLLSDADLLAREQLLFTLTTHREAALRHAVRPAVRRLVEREATFGGRFLQMLLAALLRRKLAEGVPGHLVMVLREDFSTLLPQVPDEILWRLLRSKSTAAQELGGVLLPHRLDPETVELSQLVELADRDVLSVRQAAWGLLERAIPRLKKAMGTAVQVLDAGWEDTRIFAFKFFETHFDKEDFDPAVLVSICDSVRADVQRFGRGLITRHFDEAEGEEYLLKLSEHPTGDVQLFATNFLDRFAAGSPERLEQLEPYFVRVLCGVNRGRAAKKRVHAFLRSEARGSEETARVVAAILTRQSVTIAIEERAEAIHTLAVIGRHWPAVLVEVAALRRVEPALRRRSAA